MRLSPRYAMIKFKWLNAFEVSWIFKCSFNKIVILLFLMHYQSILMIKNAVFYCYSCHADDEKSEVKLRKTAEVNILF